MRHHIHIIPLQSCTYNAKFESCQLLPNHSYTHLYIFSRTKVRLHYLSLDVHVGPSIHQKLCELEAPMPGNVHQGCALILNQINVTIIKTLGMRGSGGN